MSGIDLRPPHAAYIANSLTDVAFIESLFDRLPDVVFSVKDIEGRYVAMSSACVPRCRLRDKRDAVGRTAHELFPRHMAERYAEQDVALFAAGRPVVDKLDLTVYNDRSPGWCLSNKHPVYARDGRLLGLVCLSKDLAELTREGLVDEGFARVIDFIQAHYARALCLDELAEVGGLSVAQLDRRMKRVFHSSTGGFVRRTRVEAALHAITHSQRPLADVAAEVGFCDQSALNRHCRQATGMSPRQLRLAALRSAAA